MNKFRLGKNGFFLGSGNFLGCSPAAVAFFMILVLLVSTNSCKDRKALEEDNQNIIAGRNQCLMSNGYDCRASECLGQVIPVDFNLGMEDGFYSPGGEARICCNQQCSSMNIFDKKSSSTCSAQGNVDCNSNEYCKGNMWVSSIDSNKCCESVCNDRVLAPLLLPNGATITIESIGSEYRAWFGKELVVLGAANFAAARKNGEKYTFNLPDGQTYSFVIITHSPELEVAYSG